MKVSSRLVAVLLVLVASFVAGPAALAAPATTGPYVLNSDNTGHWVGCFDDRYFEYVEYLSPGEYSNRNCFYYRLAGQERILYKSISTGALYWTPCGRDVNQLFDGQYSGWAQVGNGLRSTQILDSRFYPDPPADVCT